MTDYDNQPKLRTASRSTSTENLDTNPPPELSGVLKAGIRITLVLLTALLSYTVSDFAAVSALSGGFGNNMVGFILPPLFIISIKRRLNWWKVNDVGLFRCWFEIIGNLGITGLGLILLFSSVQSFIKNF